MVMTDPGKYDENGLCGLQRPRCWTGLSSSSELKSEKNLILCRLLTSVKKIIYFVREDSINTNEFRLNPGFRDVGKFLITNGYEASTATESITNQTKANAQTNR